MYYTKSFTLFARFMAMLAQYNIPCRITVNSEGYFIESECFVNAPYINGIQY